MNSDTAPTQWGQEEEVLLIEPDRGEDRGEAARDGQRRKRKRSAEGGLGITCDSSSSQRWGRKRENDRRETSRWLAEQLQVDLKRLFCFFFYAPVARNPENPKMGVLCVGVRCKSGQVKDHYAHGHQHEEWWGWSYCMFELFQYTECLLADTCRSAQVRLVNTQRDSATAAMIRSWSPSLRSLRRPPLSLSFFLPLPLCLSLSRSLHPTKQRDSNIPANA